jgi:hypothetical protein
MDTEQKRVIGPVTAGAGGGAALSLVICWLLLRFFGVDVPPDVQGAFTLLLVLGGGYLVKPSHGRRAA